MRNRVFGIQAVRNANLGVSRHVANFFQSGPKGLKSCQCLTLRTDSAVAPVAPPEMRVEKNCNLQKTPAADEIPETSRSHSMLMASR
jgi:hypothetical protein